MELRFFFAILSKRKWLILTVIAAAAAATFIVVGMMPDKYKSSATITTGITEFKGIRVGDPNPFVQEFEIENKFSNLTEYMKSRPAINGLTKRLILHDLATDGTKPFRTLDKAKMNKIGLSQQRIDSYLEALKTRPDSIGVAEKDIDNMYTARTIEKELGYDYETFRDKIDMKRAEKSDYLIVEYTSEKQDLTYFVAKNFVDEFIKFYYVKKDTSESKSLVFYRKFVSDKRRILDSLNEAQTTYAKNNGLVAPLEQAQALVTQIKDIEMVRDEALKLQLGYEKTVNIYGKEQLEWKKFIQGDYAETVNNNDRIKEIDDNLNALNVKWVDSNMKDESVKRQIDDLRGKKILVSRQIALTRADITNPQITKQEDMFVKFVDAKSNYDATTQHVSVLSKRVTELYQKRSGLVNNNAEWNRYNRQIEVAAAEYKYAIDKQNQADVIKQSGEEESPMKVNTYPLYPYKAESKKRSLLSAFAGVGAGTLATVFLFMLTYFDRSIGSLFQYHKQIGLPLLAAVPLLDRKEWRDFDSFFKNNAPRNDTDNFKESVRKIRHDIESSNEKTFLFASLKEQEGKSFMVATLAYTFTLKSKKVLIIDTNFKNNTLTSLSVKPFIDNPVTSEVQTLPTATRLEFVINIPTVDIIGNQGGHNSPSELLSGVDFKRKMRELAKNYDYIFLEAACLNKYSDARELIDFVEKVIPVFDATTTLSQTDNNGLAFLHSLGDKVLGGVLNKANFKSLN